MNIALFIDTVAFAGTERHVLDLGQSLVAAGAVVIIACPAASPLTPRCLAAGLTVLDVPSSLRHAARTVKILAAELRAGRVDIIHAHNGRTHLLAVAAVKWAGCGRVVATQHFLAPNRTGRRGPKAWLAGVLHRWAEKNTAAFIAISQAVKDQMLIRGDARAEKITVVHNGTTEPEKTSAERIAALRAELGMGDGLMVFCAARLQKEKDIPTLIKAMAAVAAAAKNSESRIQNPEGNQGATNNEQEFIPARREATNNDDDGTGFTTKTQRHEGPGKNPQISQIPQITGLAGQPAGRGPAEAGQIESGGLLENSRFEVLDSNSSPTAALPQVLISDTRSGDPIAIGISASMPQRCSLVIERSAALFIAGEGDQRGECERLIAALDFNDQRSMSNDQKLGDGGGFTTKTQRHEGRGDEGTGDGGGNFHHRGNGGKGGDFTDHGSRSNDDGGDGGDGSQVTGDRLQGEQNLESRTLHSEGNEDAAPTESAALPKYSRFEVLDSNSSPTAALPQHSNSYLLASNSSSSPHPNSSQAGGGTVRLLGFRSDVSALMAACDIFVLPAPAEPFGLVIIEAMALGKPVIAAGAGGPLEIVADGETGLLFAPGNAESLAATMKRLLADADLRKRMGEAGRKRYEEMFTAQQMAEKMRDAYAAEGREKVGVRS